MKLEQLPFNKKKAEILLEIILVLAIFLVSILILLPLFLDSLNSSEFSREFSIANLLAIEGLEVTRSIRDDNWENLTSGNHGLAISEGHFVFQGEREDISDQLEKGERQIRIEDIDSNRKKVTSKISWEHKGERKEIKLVTFLTNWQKISQIEIRKPTAHTDFAGQTENPELAYDYPNGSTFAKIYYGVTADPSITFHAFETTTKNYTNLTLKVKYRADKAREDKYTIAFSTTTCQGNFVNLVSPTSTGIEDTIVSANLSPDLDLSQLCVKIYTQVVKKADRKYLYIYDIFVEGYYLE